MNSTTVEKDKALEIVRTAKEDRPRAEKLALEFVRELAPELMIMSAVINESKLSLNSVNGRLDAEGKKYFFKFHAEENEQEGSANTEYYNAKLLADSGWPVLQPIYTSHQPGMQCAIYDYVDVETAFEAYETEEAKRLSGGAYDEHRLQELLKMETELCRTIRKSFLTSLELAARDSVKKAPVHQLFYGRLVGTRENPPRIELYYQNRSVALLDGSAIPFNDFSRMRWEINTVRYEETLEEISAKARNLLNPTRDERVSSVIGHGDDHNGNRFIINGSYALFDPAFAGRQPALLSFVKATAHNIFAHPFWFYDPKKLVGRAKIDVTLKNDKIIVNHDWKTEELSPLRIKILDIYAEEVWRPLVADLSKRGWLPADWKEYVRKALFCCPFLALNLIDGARFAPPQSLLALSKCVELGAKGNRLMEYFFQKIEPQNV